MSHEKNYVTVNIFTKGIAFLSIPIFTRLLTPEGYGMVAILSSFVAIFSVIIGLGIRGVVARYYYEKSNDFDHYFVSVLFLFFS